MKERLLRDPTFGYLLIAPLLIWIGVTLFYPLLRAIVVSFMDINYFGEAGKFIGVHNYRQIIFESGFSEAFVKTLYWTLFNVILQFLLAFATALILDQEFIGKKFLRNWIVLPWVIPVIVIAIIWRWILNPTYGVVNYILESLHFTSQPIVFLGSVDLAMFTAIVINSWRWFPFYAVILLAGLQTIPEQLHEVARVDGANTLQRFRYVTLPTLMPIITIVVLISSLWAVNVFDMIWLLTQGGPGNATTTLPIFIYEKGFAEYRLAQASAAAVFMFIFLLIYGVLYLRRISPDE